ncbi:RGG repeats nuclear RNA binding protein A-like [Amaranthus tricolor]|uniref:RGG repeats nuclear RNA binding protein A-like n=1 Tax=Amaranthus tricolor TaxID=29722 RepID=UPI00258C015B|nr:RGG repeats nuclear RNA binding protein A-like [Amaranthus tricolor]
MATANPFDLLVDDAEDPSLLIAAQELKVSAAVGEKKAPAAAKAAVTKPAKLPSKPVPPSQAVREARNEGGRGVGGRGGRGYGRGRGLGGANRDFANNDDAFVNENGGAMGYKEERDRPTERRGGYGGPLGGYRGGRRGGFGSGDAADGERPRRIYERRSGTGRGGEFKREGAGRGNWGTATDEIAQVTEEPVVENEAVVAAEKPEGEENVVEKENPEKEAEEVEPEEKQMTLEEYEKVLEEKRKALLALKGEERKVNVDKEFESMQLVSKKKIDDEVFIKLGSDKDKRKDAAEKEERGKKSVSINEFLKPADGTDGYYRRGGRGRGRGRGGYGGGYGMNHASAPSIEDPNQFPTLGAN